MPCSVAQAVGNKEVMSIDPNSIGVLGNGKSQLIVIKAGLHRCTGGVAFCKVLNSKKIQYVQFLHILPQTANMFQNGTNCDSSF